MFSFRLPSPSLTLSLWVALMFFMLAHEANANIKLLKFQSRNPCHSNKNDWGRGVTCSRVVVPPLLCARCQLKQTFSLSTGKFENCHNIYDTASPHCRAQLRYYAARNRKCDPIRWAQTRDMDDEKNREGLDYFLYSICEQCCDCIPRGSREQQWWIRKRQGRNLNENRGNCPAHGFYDICKIWPKVKFLSGPRGWKDDDKATEVCPDLRKWRMNPLNKDWLYESTTVTTENVKRFFRRFFSVVRCQRKDVWVPCVRLERAQGRLQIDEDRNRTSA